MLAENGKSTIGHAQTGVENLAGKVWRHFFKIKLLHTTISCFSNYFPGILQIVNGPYLFVIISSYLPGCWSRDQIIRLLIPLVECCLPVVPDGKILFMRLFGRKLYNRQEQHAEEYLMQKKEYSKVLLS